MRRPSLESNAVGMVFHHIELNATPALRAGDTPWLRNDKLGDYGDFLLEMQLQIEKVLL